MQLRLDGMMASSSGTDTLGIIFPLSKEHIRRFFEDQKRVFVKFVGREGVLRRLQPNRTLFFYESEGNKEVVGEARIVKMGTGTVEEVIAAFGNDLFLSQTELQQYAGKRRTKRMLFLVLGNPTRYKLPLELGKSVTMSGQYMTKTMLGKLRKRV